MSDDCTHPPGLKVYEPNIPVGKEQFWVCVKCLTIGSRVQEISANDFYYYFNHAQQRCSHEETKMLEGFEICKKCNRSL